MDILSKSGKVSVVAGAMGAILLGGCIGGVAVSTMPRAAYAQQTNTAAQTEIRFQQMEKEIRRLTGQIEEQQFEIRQLHDQISKLSENTSAANANGLTPANGVNGANEYNNNVSGMAESQGYNQGIYAQPLEENGGVLVTQHNASEPPPFENQTVQTLGSYTKPAEDQSTQSEETTNNSTNNSVVLASTGDAAGDYDRAYSYIKARDFDNAERAFSSFINAYPNSDLVSNAKYWYGETFYVRGDYEHSARIFAEGYQKYPQGPKAASNLLKLGMSLVGMGKPDDACIAFKQLKQDYADSAIPVLKRADTEMEKISCN